MFDNKLSGFAKELTFISRLIQDFSEALTGDAQPAELEQLSSSIPTVAVLAGVTVIGTIATVVNKFLDAWLKVEKIRKMRGDLADMGLKGAAVDELTEHIENTVDEVVEESSELVMAGYQGNNERRNELTIAVKQDARRLFGQIERGLTVEFRTRPNEKDDETTAKALKEISKLASQLQFPPVAAEPLLLEPAEILEGDLKAVRYSRKTTSHKSTTSRKETAKSGVPESDD